MYIYIYIKSGHQSQSAQISQKRDERNIYAITKTMCPSSSVKKPWS